MPREIISASTVPDSLTSWLRQMEWRVTKLHGEALKPHGVNMYQAMSLIYIAWNGRQEAVNQRTIEKYLYLSNPGVSKIISFLEREGYVERTTDPRDARSYLLRATARGEAFAVQLNDAIQKADQKILAPLAGDERQQLRTLLEKIGAEKEADT